MIIHWKVKTKDYSSGEGWFWETWLIIDELARNLTRATPRNKTLYRKPQHFEGVFTNINIHSISHEDCWLDEADYRS